MDAFGLTGSYGRGGALVHNRGDYPVGWASAKGFFAIINHEGQGWVTIKQLADGLGYGHPDQLTRLIRRNKAEFEGKLLTVKLTGNSPGAPELIINYHGVIRAAMLSDAPNAATVKQLDS